MAILREGGECEPEGAGDVGAAGLGDFDGRGHLAFGGGEGAEDGIAAKLDDYEPVVLGHLVDFGLEAFADDLACLAGNGLRLVEDEDDADALVEPDDVYPAERTMAAMRMERRARSPFALCRALRGRGFSRNKRMGMKTRSAEPRGIGEIERAGPESESMERRERGV